MIAVALIVIDVETRSSGMPSNSVRHVLDRVDRDADAADFAGGERVIGVVAHLRRQVERDAQAADALREQIAVAPVRFRRRAEPGVLPHRPQPAAVHGRLDAARERKVAGEADVGGGVMARERRGIRVGLVGQSFVLGQAS